MLLYIHLNSYFPTYQQLKASVCIIKTVTGLHMLPLLLRGIYSVDRETGRSVMIVIDQDSTSTSYFVVNITAPS